MEYAVPFQFESSSTSLVPGHCVSGGTLSSRPGVVRACRLEKGPAGRFATLATILRRRTIRLCRARRRAERQSRPAAEPPKDLRVVVCVDALVGEKSPMAPILRSTLSSSIRRCRPERPLWIPRRWIILRRTARYGSICQFGLTRGRQRRHRSPAKLPKSRGSPLRTAC